MATEKTDVLGWAIVELMGHRRLAGYVRAVEVAGAAMLRIDVPTPETADESGPWSATQFYSPAAVYCITPTTRETAVAARGVGTVAPVTRWELPAAKTSESPIPERTYRHGEEDGDDDRPF